MRGLFTSVRYTIRLLLKSPTFTIIAVLILGVGIGTNTAIFSLLDAVVLNPLPFPHPDRLVSVANTSKEISDLGVDLPDYVDFRVAQESFDELAVARETILDLSDSAGPQNSTPPSYLRVYSASQANRLLLAARSLTRKTGSAALS